MWGVGSVKQGNPHWDLWAAGRKMKARSYGKALGPDGRRPVGKGGLLNPGCRDSVTPSFITIRSLLLLRTKPPNSGWLIPQTSPQSPVLRSSYSSFNGFGRGRRTSWTVAVVEKQQWASTRYFHLLTHSQSHHHSTPTKSEQLCELQ